jgi:CHAD domain-containing protein
MKPDQLAKAFNQNVETLEARAQVFMESGDPASTQALRKAAGRLRTARSVLPKSARKDKAVKRYLGAARRLSKATGRLRDLDTIAAWTSQVQDARDRRSFALDIARLRSSSLRGALSEAKALRKTKAPSVKARDLPVAGVERRVEKVEKRASRKVDKEFEEFLSTQEIDVMHALRKDSKRLRHLLELTRNGRAPPLLERLRSIQDELGAIRDHDLVIDYLRSRVRLTSTRALIREEIAKRHGRLEDFVSKNRGQGRVVPVPTRPAA